MSQKDFSSLFIKGWASEDKEATLFSERLSWIWPALNSSPERQTALSLWNLAQAQVLAPEQGADTLDSAYTATEQIANTILLCWILSFSGPAPDQTNFNQRVENVIHYLIANLEYYGEGNRTNNHLLNNARALYLAGVFLKREPWRAMAREIFRHELDRSITPSGFLREGSTHYHLLILRWFQEIEQVSLWCGDTEFHQWVVCQVERLRGAALFFCPKIGDPFPLMGDVSPDASPDWLIPLIHGEFKGWNSLWRLPLLSDVKRDAQGMSNSLPEGWARYGESGYRLFWHVSPEGSNAQYSHGHHDTGAFVMNVQDESVFIDPGRHSYSSCKKGLYFKGASAHNLFVVDGVEPFVSPGLNGTRFFLGDYSRGKVDCGVTDNSIVIRHDGYSRLSNVGWVSRSYRMEKDRLLIQDDFEGRGQHEVTTFFHLAPEILCTVTGESASLKTPKGVHLILREITPRREGFSLEKGEMSPAYGELRPSLILRSHRRVIFPFQQSWVLEMP